MNPIPPSKLVGVVPVEPRRLCGISARRFKLALFGDELRARLAAGSVQKNRFSKAPRSARTDTTQAFATTTDRSGEPKKIGASKKRPGKLKWTPRGWNNTGGRTPLGEPVPSATPTQRRAIGSASQHAHLTTLEAAVQERFGGYGQSYK